MVDIVLVILSPPSTPAVLSAVNKYSDENITTDPEYILHVNEVNVVESNLCDELTNASTLINL